MSLFTVSNNTLPAPQSPPLRSSEEHSHGETRRIVLRGGLAATLATALAPLAACAGPNTDAPSSTPLMDFAGVPVSAADALTVPAGYVAHVIAAWGEPVGLAGNMPPFRFDGSNTAAEQAAQMGMHHDGMQFYPLGPGRALLVMNHEYHDDGLLHADGIRSWSAEKVRKAQAAHGVSVIEIALRGNRWDVVRPSPLARRITTATPALFSGPAAGHAMLRTALDPSGLRPIGTLANCASGMTPWGTYLTCEENFIGYFNGPARLDAHQRRYGMLRGGWGLRWHEHDERFDAVRHPHEPNRFGWVVEIDPFDPTSTPIKRTALGRATREGATVAVTRDGRAVVYSGEDARFEYIYKFVTRDAIRPGGLRANRALLDHGTLYAARFDADGAGQWLALTHGAGPLMAANGFADQGEVLVKTRQACDLVGATPMDRPEWTAVAPDGWVYCTLTNNSARGGPGQRPADAANPRANNTGGHIIRWKEAGDFDATRFEWNHFVLGGDPASERADARGNSRGDAFACPDGLMADRRGLLWIQTDMSTSAMGRGELAGLGNNALLAADARTGDIRRFLVGPVGCEITGAVMAPDARTLFLNIQHPGESPTERSDPDQPRLHSNWPDFRANGRPRSATVVVRKIDGGVIGT
ncbi:MAG TPA: PhoX family phosphatase [Ramlibacter sp.]|nr:PhoX family phosphatase [Ramlibacter sp.]